MGKAALVLKQHAQDVFDQRGTKICARRCRRGSAGLLRFGEQQSEAPMLLINRILLVICIRNSRLMKRSARLIGTSLPRVVSHYEVSLPDYLRVPKLSVLYGSSILDILGINKDT